MDPKALMVHECGWLGDSKRGSTVCDEKAGNGLFACGSFGEKDMVGLTTLHGSTQTWEIIRKGQNDTVKST